MRDRSVFVAAAVLVFLGGTTGSVLRARAAEGTGLTWARRELEIEPAPHDEVAHGQYTFINTGPGPVRLERIRTNCGCTAAEASGGDEGEEYKKGETGRIKVKVRFRRGQGKFRKTVRVTFVRDGQRFVEPLGVTVDAAPYAVLDPSLLSWEHGESPVRAKKAVFEIRQPGPIHLRKAEKSGDSGWEVDWRPLEEGRRYEISVRPNDTAEGKRVRVKLITDFPSEENPLRYELGAWVSPGRQENAAGPGLLTTLLALPEGVLIGTVVLVCSAGGGLAAYLLFKFSG